MGLLQHQPREGLTYAQLEILRDWIAARTKAQLRDEGMTVLLLIMVAIAANAFAVVFIFFFELFFFSTLGGKNTNYPPWLWIVPVATVLAMYPVYYWRYRATAATIELTHGVLRVTRRRLDLPEADPFDSANHINMGVIKHEVLLFPVWAVASIIAHIGHIRRCLKPPAWTMARALAHLYRENRRVFIHDLDIALGEPDLRDAILALELQPGVLLYTENQLAISLNDELAREIAGTIQEG